MKCYKQFPILAMLILWLVPRITYGQSVPDPLKTPRVADTAAYRSDTLQEFYTMEWKRCEPAQSWFFTYAFKEGDHWRAQDYYVGSKQLTTEGTYADAALTIREGSFAYFSGGKLMQRGRYFMDQKLGWWLMYDEEGQITDSAYYLKGVAVGRGVAYYSSGRLKELRLMDRKGSGAGSYTAYYENGAIKETGPYRAGMKPDSTWVTYYSSGKIASFTEFKGNGTNSQTCFNPQGKIIDCGETMPSFPGGADGLSQFLSRNIRFPEQLKNIYTNARVLAQFTVTVEGKVEDIRIMQSPHSDFDREVLRILRFMPDWTPGMYRGMPVEVQYTVPITFRAP